MTIFLILFTCLNFILCQGNSINDTDNTDNIDNTNYTNYTNYTKITLYSNGTAKDEEIFIDEKKINTTEYEMLSIVDGNKLIIYENNNSESICSYSNTKNISNVSSDYCKELTPNVKNKNNLCCLLETNYTSKEDNEDDDKYHPKRCVQVNKFEINRFRGITKNILNYYKEYNKDKDDYNKIEYNVSILTCHSKYYKINELFIFILLFILLII